ncbi:MAG: isopentenyl-diphosphate Delta-isomerase [Crocinitomicaceae bacterium]|jgi:isopentenyl-diphosphate delta-isomerase|nr:isopentenyl-diphosphate Delta-isomerase [Crocinitomicaceae bacterium]
MQAEEQLILVDEQDKEVGFLPKLEVHQKGLLHRAFSILIFNSRGEFLIHQRAHGKYHSPGLWTNTCCSHPNKGESTEAAAHRRLQEEMGFDCKLVFVYKFIYKTELENNLTEHELDHVFIGEFNGEFKPNPEEVFASRWISLNELREDIRLHPENYTFWFKKIVSEHLGSFRFPMK